MVQSQHTAKVLFTQGKTRALRNATGDAAAITARITEVLPEADKAAAYGFIKA